VIDFGREIERRLEGVSPRSVYENCSGHLNASGYRLLAEIAFDFLTHDNQVRRLLADVRSLRRDVSTRMTPEP
jgi:hypothetical protein